MHHLLLLLALTLLIHAPHIIQQQQQQQQSPTTPGNVAVRLSVLDATLRAKLVEFGVTLRAIPPVDEDPTNPLLLRLIHPTRGDPLRAALLTLSDQAAGARFSALPHALTACTALDGAVQQFLLKMLMTKVMRHLAGVPSMPEWTSGAAEGAGGMRLPAFSVYPAAYITAVGEYLMMLPQLLEALEGSDEEDAGYGVQEEEESAGEQGGAEAAVEGEWLDKVCEGGGGGSCFIYSCRHVWVNHVDTYG